MNKSLIGGAVALAVLLAGCTGAGAPAQPAASGTTPTPTQIKQVKVLTHDSFALPEETVASFEKDTGYKLQTEAIGDGGALVNQLILTKDAPLGDAVFGIDNTFAGRAIKAGILAPYTSSALPQQAEPLTQDGAGVLTPIDYGDVCLNADQGWFKAKGLAIPQTFDDLLKPEYQGLLVVPNPASSTPGLAMLVATVAAKGDGWLDYWKQLRANGVKIVPGWTEAYTVNFSGSAGDGAYPLVLSYSTSPASEVGKDGKPRTVNLPKTCLRQVEYAGVLAGAKNEPGARAFVDWMLSHPVQSQIPDNMWMSPVDPSATVPAGWPAANASPAGQWYVPAETIAANRDTWIRDWTAAVVG